MAKGRGDPNWKRRDKAEDAKCQVRYIKVVAAKVLPPRIPKWMLGAGTSVVKGTKERYRHFTASGPGIMPPNRHRPGPKRLRRAESNHHPSYLAYDRMVSKLIAEGHSSPARHAREHAK